jgi:hypothetical protein
MHWVHGVLKSVDKSMAEDQAVNTKWSQIPSQNSFHRSLILESHIHCQDGNRQCHERCARKNTSARGCHGRRSIFKSKWCERRIHAVCAPPFAARLSAYSVTNSDARIIHRHSISNDTNCDRTTPGNNCRITSAPSVNQLLAEIA